MSMKVVILAGGLGTRLSEYTDKIPKPMVQVGGKPILWHIMQRYAMFGYKDFVIALGYKGEIIKDYFLRFSQVNSNFTVNLRSGKIEPVECLSEDWNVTLVDTGETTMTGGRLKRLERFIDGDTFLMTYGDGVADIDIGKLIEFHCKEDNLATVTAVRPPTRFGELSLNGTFVERFEEKPQMNDGWISGGYFVLKKSILELINDDETMFEREPLEAVASMGQLNAYRHEGFWQCMDTKRDLDALEGIIADTDGAPWLRKNK